MSRFYQIVGILSLISAAFAQCGGRMSEESFRLPAMTHPEKYKLILSVEIVSDLQFAGDVDITIKVVENTDQIILNSKNLNIENVELKEIGCEMCEPIDVTHTLDSEKEFLVIQTENEVCLESTKSYSLKIIFSGFMRKDYAGFFNSSYFDDDKQGYTNFVATMLKPIGARSAFPCYDEPEFKATFSLQIIHPAFLSAISNGAIEKSTSAFPGYNLTEFKDVKNLSPSSLWFSVSDFKEHVVNRKHSIYGKSSNIKNAAYAADIIPEITSKMEEYFQLEPLVDQSKFIHLTISEHNSTITDSDGLIIYKEADLYHDDASTPKQKAKIQLSVATGLASQYFGQLVIPKWWDFAWLSEGFSTLYGYLGANMLEKPSIEYSELFIMDQMHYALQVDALVSTKPMTNPVNKPMQIEQQFNSITTSKAASVLNMIRHAIGDQNFKSGVQHYLEEKMTEYVSPSDLYKNIQTQIEDDLNIAEIMASWTDNAGYPLVHAKRNYESKTIVLSQELFSSGQNGKDDKIWSIPLNHVASTDPNFYKTHATEWLLTKEMTIDGPESSKTWVIFNKQQTGFYRVNYDEENWKSIAETLTNKLLNDDFIHHKNRAQLLDDSFNLFKAGVLKFDTPLNLMQYLPRERNLSPWIVALKNLEFMETMFFGTDEMKIFETFALFFLDEIYNEMHVDKEKSDEPLSVKLLRENVIKMRCRLGCEDCTRVMNNKLVEAIEKEVTISANLTSIVYCNGLLLGNEKEFKYLKDKIINSRSQEEREMLIDSLGCSKSTNLLRDTLDESVNFDNNLSVMERKRIWKSVSSGNLVGLDVTLNYLSDYMEKLPEWLHSVSDGIESVLLGVATKITNEKQKVKIQRLLEQGYTDDDTRDRILEIINFNIEWAKSSKKTEMWNQVSDYVDKLRGSASGVIVSSLVLLFSILSLYFVQ